MKYDRNCRRSTAGRAEDAAYPAQLSARLRRRRRRAGALLRRDCAPRDQHRHARRWRWRKLPDAFQDYRIAQISDIHFDEYTEPSFVRRVVGEVNRLAPDLVLLTGDYISNSPLGQDFAVRRHAALRRDAARAGLPAALRGDGQPRLLPGRARLIRAGLATASIPLLVNQHVADRAHGPAAVAGGRRRPPYQCAQPAASPFPRNPDGPVLLLCHAPDYADNVLAHPRGALVDLMLAGHSHGGPGAAADCRSAASRGWRAKSTSRASSGWAGCSFM